MTEQKFTAFFGSPSGQLQTKVIRRSLGPTEARIKQTHSGVCSTDLHLADREVSLGHEGIGVVEELGDAAHYLSDVKVGDRVGFGWMQRYCGKCKPCRGGYDSLCINGKELWASNNDTGSFGTGGIWDVSALRSIPDEIESKYAAPLMCAGATVWGAMQRCKVMSHHRVGVLGIGGLGHLAIQFLAKSGCEVVVISSSGRKEKEAFEYGATEYWTVEQIKRPEESGFRKLDHLLICTGAQPDYTLYMPLMAMAGNISPLTVDFETTPIPLAATVFGGVNIFGAKICNRNEYDDMFRFAVRHKIRPTIQEYAMTEDGLNDAVKALKEGKAHYRAVAVA